MIIYLVSSTVQASEEQNPYKDVNVPSPKQMGQIITKINNLDLKKYFDSDGNMDTDKIRKYLRKEFIDTNLPLNPNIKSLLELDNYKLNFIAKHSFDITNPIKLPSRITNIFSDIDSSKFEDCIDFNADEYRNLTKIRQHLLKTLKKEDIEFLKNSQIVPHDDIFNFLSRCILEECEPIETLKELIKSETFKIDLLKTSILREYLIEKFGFENVQLYKKLEPIEQTRKGMIFFTYAPPPESSEEKKWELTSTLDTREFLQFFPHFVTPTMGELMENVNNIELTNTSTEFNFKIPNYYRYIRPLSKLMN